MRINNESQVTECTVGDERQGTTLQDEVVSWAEEHKNLCTIATSLTYEDPDLQKKIRTTLSNSMEKGKKLIAALMETSSRSVTAAGDSPLRRSTGPIPLSGFKRFDEQGVAMTGRATVRPPSSTMASAGVSGFVSPVPSRTYLKKSLG